MPFQPHIVDELNVLMKFSRHTMQQGIKVHHDADPAVIEATERLYSKGIVSQIDGGYLTDRGVEVAKIANSLIDVLEPKL